MMIAHIIDYEDGRYCRNCPGLLLHISSDMHQAFRVLLQGQLQGVVAHHFGHTSGFGELGRAARFQSVLVVVSSRFSSTCPDACLHQSAIRSNVPNRKPHPPQLRA